MWRPPEHGEPDLERVRAEHARSGTASAFATNAPGDVAVRGDLEAWASSSVATTPPIIDRITSASRL